MIWIQPVPKYGTSEHCQGQFCFYVASMPTTEMTHVHLHILPSGFIPLIKSMFISPLYVQLLREFLYLYKTALHYVKYSMKGDDKIH